MEPPNAKRPHLENSSLDFSPNVAVHSSIVYLPEDLITYVGRFLVKSPGLHLFFPASKKLAGYAKKAFADFANDGGSLQFFSSHPERVIEFGITQSLHTLNLRGFASIPRQPLQKLVANVLQIKGLSIDASLAKNLPVFLGYFSNLQSLNLHDCRCDNLIFMSQFQQLHTFKMMRDYDPRNIQNEGSFLVGLETLTNLTHLQVDHAIEILDASIDVIGKLGNLRTLSLSTSIFPSDFLILLGGLTNLTSLDLANCGDIFELTRFAPNYDMESDDHIDELRKLTNLTHLDISCGCVFALAFSKILDNFTNLHSLQFVADTSDASPDADLSHEHLNRISTLTNLTHLNLAYQRGLIHPSVYATLKPLRLLKRLDVSQEDENPGVVQLNHLEELVMLEHLDISGSSKLTLEQFTSIGKLTNLKFLNLAGLHYVTEAMLACLRNLTRLGSIDLQMCFKSHDSPSTFTALSHLPALQALHLTIEEASDSRMSSLPAMTNLRKLSLAHNFWGNEQVWDKKTITLIENLTQLLRLDIHSLKLEDVHLKSIVIKLTNLQELELMRGLPRSAETDRLIKSKIIRLILK